LHLCTYFQSSPYILFREAIFSVKDLTALLHVTLEAVEDARL
jgi:hypothetical protein